jgi:hypothetical protein
VRRTIPPTLGVTATLLLLWLAAAATAGPDSASAAALDPGRTGSLGAWWGGMQLALALLLAAGLPGHRLLALAPAALMAGELGELHVHAATLVATAAGAARHLGVLKALAGGMLGLTALAASLRIRHRSCFVPLALSLLVGGGVSILADGAQSLGLGGAFWAAAEEWSELAVYSVVAASMLAMKIKS